MSGYSYPEGVFYLSRALTKREYKKVVEILDFQDDEEEGDDVVSLSQDRTRIYISTEFDHQYNDKEPNFRELISCLQKKGVTIGEKSYILYEWDFSESGAYYIKKGEAELKDHGMKEYYIWSADTKSLIEELNNRGYDVRRTQ